MVQNVFFITTSDLSGTSGNNIATKEIAAAFARNDGIDLTLICPNPDSQLPSEVTEHVSEVAHFTSGDGTPIDRMKTQWSLFRTVRPLLSKHNPDYIVSRQSATLVIPPLVAKRHRVPHVLLIRGRAYTRLKFPRLLWTVFSLNVRMSSGIYCAYEKIEEEVRSVRSDAPVQVFNNAVDPTLFEPISKGAARGMTDLGVPDENIVIGFVGSIRRRHRLKELFEAASRSEYSDRISLVIVGDGPQQEDLKQLADDLALEDVTFTGFVPHNEVSKYINACDVLYGVADPDRPSDPIKCYEYLACSRPVLASEFRFEFVDEVDAGLTVSEIDPDEIALCIDSFVSMDDSQREAMGERGRDYVLENHTWDQLPEKIESKH
ncbi:glycosyltransferase family 4 protein [Natronorubrum daqingense]|uniref:Glycosyltransferase involved in cell wall bisynthesis n=1 Tax=Natronorubrum daqingense TaxID=588898 RepID=A0A1N7FXV1_9EURY|nr:glycosyltransferase family 4 protein [Natronorubrum daqingense]APX98546.1 hypothetical protein BB347_17730 [Natronorubrum daqingense]SIS05151.1 Glycosyltransferase involved in cell wall bisynthesis [Natronorubrum daqingense]